MPEPKSRSCRVLIVEDEYFIADEIAHELAAAGIDVADVVRGARGAHDALDAEAVDLVLLDINLSGEASYALARELRTRGVPFVFVTGYDRSALPSEFRTARLLQKPCGGKDLIAAIRDAMPE
jgi:DNA-binding response OmpR family regulator